MIHVGVIGCGRIAQVRHLPEYAENKNVVITGVYDLNHERAEAIARQYGAKAYSSHEELLADQEIEAVSVCAANNAHAQITIEALKAGKHVLCEKPMAVTLDECVEMVETAERCGKYLMIGHNQRLAPSHKRAKELIAGGAIGKILTFKTNFAHCGPETWTVDSQKNWFFDKSKSVFGAMADLGIHKTDLIQYLTDQKITEVEAVVTTLDKRDSRGQLIQVDDNALCIYRMEQGIIGTMTVSWTCYGKEENSTILYGTQGVMRIYDDPNYSIIIEKRDGTREFYQVDQIQTNDHQTKSGVIDMWVDCLVNHHEPEISGKEALSAMKAVFAALESSRTGQKVCVRQGGL